MNTTLLIFIIITLHFIGDWVLQPRSRARSKKDNIQHLLNHMFEVTFYVLVCTMIIGYFYLDNNVETIGDSGLYVTSVWLVSNVVLHFFIDLHLPAGNNERQMINYTALDQILHIGCLLLTLEYFIL